MTLSTRTLRFFAPWFGPNRTADWVAREAGLGGIRGEWRGRDWADLRRAVAAALEASTEAIVWQSAELSEEVTNASGTPLWWVAGPSESPPPKAWEAVLVREDCRVLGWREPVVAGSLHALPATSDRVARWWQEPTEGPRWVAATVWAAGAGPEADEWAFVPTASGSISASQRDAFGAGQNAWLREQLALGAEGRLARLREVEGDELAGWEDRLAGVVEDSRRRAGEEPCAAEKTINEPPRVDTAALEAALEAATAVTLDVFDTLLIRRVGKPTDVFWLLGREVERAEGLSAEAFVRHRIEAERCARAEARARDGTEDVTWAQIYTTLGRSLAWASPVIDRWRRREGELEAAVLRAHPEARRLGDRLWSKARLGLSEMYLPSAQIRGWVERELGRSLAPLWVSGERGLSKGTGNLYAAAEVELGLPATACCHLGDNPVSDGEVPRARGWRTIAWPRWEGSRLDRPSNWQPASRFASVALGVVRAERRFDDALPAQLGFELLGPLVFSWLNHLAQSPSVMAADHVWCLGRDAYWVERLWRTLPPTWQPTGRLRYQPSSRQLWGLGTIEEIGADDWEFLLKAAPEMTAADFLARTGVDPTKAVAHPALSWEAVLTGPRGFLDGRDRDRLYELFVANIEAFHQARVQRRSALLASLAAANPEGGTVAYVDLGWHGSSARTLTTLARDLGWPTPQGEYLATWTEAAAAQRVGARFGSFFVHLGAEPARVRLLRENIALLESLFSAPTPTVVGVAQDAATGEWEAVHAANELRTPAQLAVLAQCWAGAERFVESIVGLMGEPIPDPTQELAARALGGLLRAATASEKALFAAWPHVEGWGMDRAVSLPGGAT